MCAMSIHVIIMLPPIQYTLVLRTCLRISSSYIHCISSGCVFIVCPAGIIFGNHFAGVTGSCCPCRQPSETCTFWVSLHVRSISGRDLYIDHYSMVGICLYSYLFSSDCMRDKLTIPVSETLHYISLTVHCMIKSLSLQECNTHCVYIYVCVVVCTHVRV